MPLFVSSLFFLDLRGCFLGCAAPSSVTIFVWLILVWAQQTAQVFDFCSLFSVSLVREHSTSKGFFVVPVQAANRASLWFPSAAVLLIYFSPWLFFWPAAPRRPNSVRSCCGVCPSRFQFYWGLSTKSNRRPVLFLSVFSSVVAPHQACRRFLANWSPVLFSSRKQRVLPFFAAA
jgi:hypothetical protein